MTRPSPLGAILAGGRSTRMGVDKALVDLAGRPMIEYTAEALEAAGCRVAVIGRSDRPAGIHSVPDSPAGRRGPVAGLSTALRIAAGAPVVLVGVDQPFVRPQTIRHLLAVADGDAVVPIDSGKRQPTCAVYWPNCAAIVDDLLTGADDPPLHAVLDRVPLHEIVPDTWRSWGEDGSSWWSVNTPDDLAAATARMA
ncbi:MAG: molybdenum cofactor guanylyltransferase [Acidimicrobiia bacterium]|nr:molybdenum cofactor guanylyltransferase [Acidimicrobiia bacterium]